MRNRNTIVAVLASACLVTAGVLLGTTRAAGDDDAAATHLSIALHMGLMQRYAQKLGYALQGKNKPLAAYYAKELEERADVMKAQVPTHEGIQVAQFVDMMLAPQLERMQKTVAVGDWAAAGKRYHSLVNACNGCHTAAKHPYIQIKPAEGKAPFSQTF